MIIRISNLSAKYGKNYVLNNINLDIDKSQSICVLGENSSGKSTFLKCICKLKKYEGKIEYANNLKIFYLPQDSILIEELSVLDNMKLFLEDIKGVHNDEIVLEFGLDKIFNKKVKTLSGGVKRKVSLCIALMEENDILILDEPFVSLDNKHRQLFLSKLKNKVDLGQTVIYTTHLNDTITIASHKFYLLNGSLEELKNEKI